jgi:FkbM family methyltransferase
MFIREMATRNKQIGFVRNTIRKLLYDPRDLEVTQFLLVVLPMFFLRLRRKKILSSKNGIKIFGRKLVTIPDDEGISRELKITGFHEPINTRFLKTLLKPGMTCIDIGSNIGYYVLLESVMVGSDGKIIAIEPSPRAYKYLQKNISLNTLKNVEKCQFAVGDFDGTVDFRVSAVSNTSAVVTKQEPFGNQPSDDLEPIITVPVMQLDSFVRERQLQRLDFLRMDVEGYETRVINGSLSTLKQFRPMIMMEIHIDKTNPSQTLEITNMLRKLEQLGYKMILCFPRRIDMVGGFVRFKLSHEQCDLSGLAEKIEMNQIQDSHLFQSRSLYNYSLFLGAKEN